MRYEEQLENEMQHRMILDKVTEIDKGGHANRGDELDDLLEECKRDDDGTKPSIASDAAVAPAVSMAPSGTTTATPAQYRFPVSDDATRLCNSGESVNRLEQLVAEYQKHGDYLAIRDEYCSLSIALNHARQFAPAFRPTPKIPRITSKRSKAHMTLHQDQVVIDCHWLRCRGEVVTPDKTEFQPLFCDTVPFSFELAATFACRNWSRLYRTDEALILTTWQQTQLTTLQGEAVRGRRAAAKDGVSHGASRIPPKITAVKRAMREWAQRNKLVVPEQKAYEDLWLARELLGVGSAKKEIAILGGLISGAPPLSEKTVRDKLRKLDDRMSGV